ncbi:MAG: twin-arginine translocation signal domain-containing protein, partial [Gammaproteobacteria bacterium]|nr:twin-arginine translocation signal domain-containing protein [Gammaproteobacteria bacterium]
MNDELKYLAKEVAQGRLNRRQFLGRAGALGVSMAFAGTMVSTAVQAEGPVKGGTLRVGVEGGSSSDTLDPALITNNNAGLIGRLWGEPIVELADDGSLKPVLCEEFSSSPDAKVWKFKIRKGVSFSNGKALTAADVQATLERHAGEDSKSGALGILQDIASISSQDGVVAVELNSANADFPYLLTDYHLMIQPNGGKDDPAAGIGTGPYVIQEFDPGVRTVASKNPDYWGSYGHAETVEIITLNDDTARTSALQSGQVDMISRVPPKVASLVARAPNLQVVRRSGPGHYVFIMHCDTAP